PGLQPVDPAALELPPGQRRGARVLAGVPLEVALVLRLPGELAQVPAHAPPGLGERGHDRSPAAASARFSSAVAMSPDGATMVEGTAGTSVLGSGSLEVSARYHTTTAFAITMTIRAANRIDSTPSTVEFVTTARMSSRSVAGASTWPSSSAAA